MQTTPTKVTERNLAEWDHVAGSFAGQTLMPWAIDWPEIVLSLVAEVRRLSGDARRGA